MLHRSVENKENKLLGLELFRFISALSVLLWHYQHFSYVGDRPVNFVREQQPFYDALRFFYSHGYWGVEAFWCISGFIFFWKYRLAISNGTIAAKKFFYLRLSRLYPLHFLTLVIVLVLQAWYFQTNSDYYVYRHNDAYHFALQMFMASDWGLERGASFNGPIWSVSVEVLVYFFFYTVVRLFGAGPRSVCAVLTICVGFKLLPISAPFFNCLAMFYLGGGIAMLANKPLLVMYRTRIDIFLAISLLSFLALYAFGGYGASKNFHYSFTLLFVPALTFLASGKWNVGHVLRVIIQSLGGITYSCYLIHFPIQLSIVIAFSHFDKKVPFNDSSFFMLFFLCTLILAYYVNRFFEVPLQAAIRRMSVGSELSVKKV